MISPPSKNINDLVFELPNTKFSNSLGNGRTDFRVFREDRHSCFDVTLKAVTQTLDLAIEVGNSLFKFRLRKFKEASLRHCRRDRSLAKTSSAGAALISPALYPAYLRSASSAQRASLSSSEISSRLSRSWLASSALAVRGSSSASAAMSLSCLTTRRFYQIMCWR